MRKITLFVIAAVLLAATSSVAHAGRVVTRSRTVQRGFGYAPAASYSSYSYGTYFDHSRGALSYGYYRPAGPSVYLAPVVQVQQPVITVQEYVVPGPVQVQQSYEVRRVQTYSFPY